MLDEFDMIRVDHEESGNRTEELTIHVTFPERFASPSRLASRSIAIPASSIFADMGDLAMASDEQIKTAAARYVEEVEDMAPNSVDLSSLYVSRPATGSIAVMAKPSFGDSRGD